MGKKVFIYFILAVFFVSAVSGCSSMPKKVKEEMTGIKSKVDTLESRVESVENKQAEVERVTAEQGQVVEDMKAAKERQAKTNISVKSRSSKSKSDIKDIQLCLKNAGFYDGEIDGVKGKKTIAAIKEFQKANGLTADGVVGKKTWEALSKYLGVTSATK